MWLNETIKETRNYKLSHLTFRDLQCPASSDGHPQVLYCRCHWCLLAHASVVVCLYMRVAGAVIHVMRGRSWLEDLRTDNKYTIWTLGKFVTTYPTDRSHSGFYVYKESKSRLGLRKCAVPFSPAFRLISWAIKCGEEDKENHIIFYFVFWQTLILRDKNSLRVFENGVLREFLVLKEMQSTRKEEKNNWGVGGGLLNFTLLLELLVALRPLSEPWPPVFSSSIQSHVSPLRADLCYWAISHPSALCLSIYSSAFRRAFFLRDFLPEFVSGFCCARCSKTPLIRTLVIQIAKYPAWLGPSGKVFDNSTKLTYLEFTGYRIKYRTCYGL